MSVERILSSRDYFLLQDEHHPPTRVTEFHFGKVSLESIAKQTDGNFSKNWWVLNQARFQKEDFNTGRVTWDFSKKESQDIETRSNMVSNRASLIVIKDLTKQMKISSIQKIIKPEYRAFIEFLEINNEKRLIRNIWEFDSRVKVFFAEEDNGVGELFIPFPCFLNNHWGFNGRINCFSISPRSKIRQSSGSICNDGKTVSGFNTLMHSEVQRLLIEEHQRYSRDRK